MPYIFPFVDPYVRASITNPLEFSIDVWKQNYEYELTKNRLISYTNQFEFFSRLGFDDMLTSDICLYYYNYLKDLI